MASSLGELFVELGVFADTKELKQFEEKLKKINNTMQKTQNKNKDVTKSFISFAKGLVGVATAIGTAIFALQKLTDSLITTNQEYLNLTRNSDIALDTFQKWDNVGRMFGVKNAAQQIESLNQRLYELKLTGQGAKGFILAGINPLGQDAQGVMEQLRGRVAGLSDTSASYLLQQMGIDPQMLHLLRLGREEFESLGKTIEKYQLKPEQVKQIQKLNIQLQIAQIKIKYLKDKAILAILPHFTRVIESLAKVSEFLTTTKIGAIGLGLALTGTLIPAVMKLFAVLAANPILAAITAGLIAIYFIIDDIMTYMQGGDSLLGMFLNRLEEIAERIKAIDLGSSLQKILIPLKAISNLKAPPFIEQLITLLKLLNRSALGGKVAEDSLISTGAKQAINNSSIVYNNDNRQVMMQNSIQSTQTANDIYNSLIPLQYSIFGAMP